MIEFTGVDLAGPSYEGRVFLNNPQAGPNTPLTAEQGYAGSFHVYGYGQTPEIAHKAVPTARLPIRRSVVASEAVRQAVTRGPTATVTLVAVAPEVAGDGDAGNDDLTVDGVSIRAES